MHFVEVRCRGQASPSPQGNVVHAQHSRGTLDDMDGRQAAHPGDFHRQPVEQKLRDPEFRGEYERLYREMFEQFAPATDGPLVNPGRKRRGRLIFGDARD